VDSRIVPTIAGFATKHPRSAVMLSQSDKHDKILSLTARYASGDLSETVYEASLIGLVDKDERRYLIMLNQSAHRNSMAYRRGDVT
jgi:hypothetical protein